MSIDWRFAGRVLLKALALFALVNVLFVLTNPMTLLNEVSLYNTVFPGRERLPNASDPAQSYSVTLDRLEGMLASHVLTGTEKENEYRVYLLGDSGIWGWRLEPDETLAACINAMDVRMPDGKRLRAYNLAYPVLNVLKDLLILDYAMPYEPDMVVWFTTLASLYPQDQFLHSTVRSHPTEVRELIERFELNLDADELPEEPSGLDLTVIGQREALADWLRHQVYGVAWTATGIDHVDTTFFAPVRANLDSGETLFDGSADSISEVPTDLPPLALDVLAAGAALAKENDVSLLLINEPIYRSSGVQSDVRYNFYYPRWAYDAYREVMPTLGLPYVDFWDAVPNEAFTDTALHITPEATCDFAQLIVEQMLVYANDSPPSE